MVESMPKQMSVRDQTLVSVILVMGLLVGTCASAARGDTPLDGQVTVTNVDPNGNGKSTFTVYYHLPTQAQVGTSLTVPVKLYVADLTGLMSFLQDYTVQVTLNLNNGRVISGQVGVNSTQAAENLGAGQLHAGQEWGPANITMPLTQGNTGLASGQQALGNVTLRVDADVWFNQPINFFRPEGNQSGIGYVLISNGVPSGSVPNYAGFALLGTGVVLLAVSFVMRPRKPSPAPAEEEGPRSKKAPGSV